jgi:hypothetical protein
VCLQLIPRHIIKTLGGTVEEFVMRFAVRNLKNKEHTICRTTGIQITIQPLSYVVIDTDNDQEIQFWINIKKDVLDRCGLDVLTSERDIYKLESSSGVTSRNVSVVDGFASPMVEDITKGMNNCSKSDTDNNYSEENLLKLPKEDLFNICENFGIKYKRSNSVKTLVKLILGSDKL